MHALLALLALPRIMPAAEVVALFREISAGRAACAEAVKDALRPFAQPPPREVRTDSAEEVAVIQEVMARADAAAAAAAAAAATGASGGNSDNGSVTVLTPAAVLQPPVEVKKKGEPLVLGLLNPLATLVRALSPELLCTQARRTFGSVYTSNNKVWMGATAWAAPYCLKRWLVALALHFPGGRHTHQSAAYLGG